MPIRPLRLGALAALLVVAPASRVSAQVIHDNGTPNGVVGYTVAPPFWVADNFTLSSSTNLGSFNWFAYGPGTGGPATRTDNYQWRIFSDALGQPGAIVGNGTVVGGTGTKTAYNGNGFDIYSYDAGLGSLTLGPGSYWLAIGQSDPNQAPYWAASAQSGDAMQSSAGTGAAGTYATINKEMAFSISAAPTTVPEPASIVLLATGLAGVFGAARRKRSTSSAS